MTDKEKSDDAQKDVKADLAKGELKQQDLDTVSGGRDPQSGLPTGHTMPS